MPRKPVNGWTLLRAGLRRRPWQVMAGALASAVAAGALFATFALFTGMQTLLGQGLERLGADLIVALPGQGAAVSQFLQTGQAPPMPAGIPADAWARRVRAARVIGVEGIRGWSFAGGGEGEPAPGTASVLLIQLDGWASPILAREDVAKALPEAEVHMAEQSTRAVARSVQPLLQHLIPTSAVALLGAVLLTALLTAIRVAERRSELGMLRAIGATRLAMIGLTLGEVALLGLAGGLAGVALALGLVQLAIPQLPAAGLVLPGLGAVALTLTATLAAALGPALRSAAMDPLEAARRV